MTDQPVRARGLYQAIGPGIMYAGAAIGVSHLVQATRAGAGYGFALVWAVIAIHVLKYPYFEYAHRYTAATGENLLVGYRRVGRWALWSFLLIALGLSVLSATVLTIVTAGMADQLFGVDFNSLTWAVILLVCCTLILATGGYKLLEGLLKVLMAALALCTVAAVIAAVGHGRAATAPDFEIPDLWDVAGISFIVALMGWMPTPVDASTFSSLWMEERARQSGHRPSLREALFDFKLGYAGSLFCALMFLSLGAMVMYGTGETFAGGAADFAAQFVGMYTQALGEWSRPIITAAAFITMFSTLLTVLDGYPRVLAAGVTLSIPRMNEQGRVPYWVILIVMMAGSLLVFAFLTSHMRTLVDIATTLAFLSAPLFAYLNCRVIASSSMPPEASPPRWLKVLSWGGLVFLTGFSVVFLVVRFGYGR